MPPWLRSFTLGLAVLGSLTLMSQATLAQAGLSPACQRVQQDYLVQKSRLNARQVNFLLFDAAEHGCDALIETLLGQGASLQARNRGGNTAFLLAARAGKRGTLKVLMAQGADMAQRNLDGSNAVLLAAEANRSGTVKLLLSAAVSPLEANRRGVTPLMAAAFNGNSGMTKLLLEAGAKPGAFDVTGKSAMIYAAARGFSRVIEALLDAGADANQRGGNELTPLIWAAGHSNDVPEAEAIATIDLLLARGADPDLTDNRGQSALITAARQEHSAVYAHLIQAGADASLRDEDGKSAEDWLKSASAETRE